MKLVDSFTFLKLPWNLEINFKNKLISVWTDSPDCLRDITEDSWTVLNISVVLRGLGGFQRYTGMFLGFKRVSRGFTMRLQRF